MRRDPRTLGIERSRWRLADLLACVPELGLRPPQGLGQRLARWGIAYQRGRAYIHSPDPDYAAKQAALLHARQAAHTDPATQVLRSLDEVTVCRQPTVARAWEARGRAQPLAQRSPRSDTETRLVGAIAAETGAVQSLRAAKITVPVLRRFCQALVAAYPGRTRTVVVDNWPVHCHPDLLVGRAPQVSPFPRYLPPSWPATPSATAVETWGGLGLPIQLLPLPTDAAWCNPIEKLWRKLRQELGHLHPWADDLPRLRTELDAWLAHHQHPSPELRRYVGLATHD